MTFRSASIHVELHMPELPALDAAGRASADRVQPAEAADTSPVMHDVVDSRARLCFRALSLGLAAFVLLLLALSLSAVTGAFVEHARERPVEALHATPADLLTDVEAPSIPTSPVSAWPHAIVAVISLLTIGEIVLAIGLIRATFSMKVNTDVSATLEKETPPANSGLPGIELLKAAADTIKVVIEGLPKR